MDCIVFPRPISSARMPLTPFSCRRIIQLSPSSWYCLILSVSSPPPSVPGWAVRNVASCSSTSSLSASTSSCTSAPDTDDGFLTIPGVPAPLSSPPEPSLVPTLLPLCSRPLVFMASELFRPSRAFSAFTFPKWLNMSLCLRRNSSRRFACAAFSSRTSDWRCSMYASFSAFWARASARRLRADSDSFTTLFFLGRSSSSSEELTDEADEASEELGE
mmetsp:Transcript_21927/g.51715  ORF Transcript_21927/g.51715 Transcript_21927/m.51715 type:complete len:217 (-) Transcript_21927:939-1589(-)